ncbi:MULTISPECIES: hypothetical protein [Fictibacillus]|jgi:hypothetical protein|nr:MULTISPECIES: hypothetical protein [unclassified Fictibacillus]MBH0155381.1 hypothetical protein [Fictibacillus sp. 5RED26]MBH0161472.1 hypothetical protein [Fictibacillus sp. 26RED30]MBH0164826.1 hypothetical protein [Fictibacillus sp. 7GRE50]MBH0172575.1 hypothetical protein [Fictibacillus sp. 23RED33]
MKKVNIFVIICLLIAISPAAKVMSPTTTDPNVQLSHFTPEPQILVE